MEELSERYDLKPAAAWIRGHAVNEGLTGLPDQLSEMPIDALTDEELTEIVAFGKSAGIKLYPF